MRARPKDLRHKVLKAFERSMSTAQAARLFDVSDVSRAICAETARDALGFFEHCGYRIAEFNRYEG